MIPARAIAGRVAEECRPSGIQSIDELRALSQCMQPSAALLDQIIEGDSSI
jgi:hypothetical protein